MAFGNLGGTTGKPWMDRGSAVGEWKRALATAIFRCAAVLFAGGVAVGLWFGRAMASELWQHQDSTSTSLSAFIATPWLVYMGITGLTAFLVRDYRQDRWPSSP
jgi:hypothetical protein